MPSSICSGGGIVWCPGYRGTSLSAPYTIELPDERSRNCRCISAGLDEATFHQQLGEALAGRKPVHDVGVRSILSEYMRGRSANPSADHCAMKLANDTEFRPASCYARSDRTHAHGYELLLHGLLALAKPATASSTPVWLEFGVHTGASMNITCLAAERAHSRKTRHHKASDF